MSRSKIRNLSPFDLQMFDTENDDNEVPELQSG